MSIFVNAAFKKQSSELFPWARLPSVTPGPENMDVFETLDPTYPPMLPKSEVRRCASYLSLLPAFGTLILKNHLVC